MPLLRSTQFITDDHRVHLEVVNISGQASDADEPACSIIFSVRSSHPSLFICRSSPLGDVSATPLSAHESPTGAAAALESVYAVSERMWVHYGLPPAPQDDDATGHMDGLPLLVPEELPDYILLPGERRVILLDLLSSFGVGGVTSLPSPVSTRTTRQAPPSGMPHLRPLGTPSYSGMGDEKSLANPSMKGDVSNSTSPESGTSWTRSKGSKRLPLSICQETERPGTSSPASCSPRDDFLLSPAYPPPSVHVERCLRDINDGSRKGMPPPASPMLYIYYERLGDEGSCASAARLWLKTEREKYSKWQAQCIYEVVLNEKRLRCGASQRADAKRDHVSKRMRTRGQIGGGTVADDVAERYKSAEGASLSGSLQSSSHHGPMPSLVYRSLPPALGERVRWRRGDTITSDMVAGTLESPYPVDVQAQGSPSPQQHHDRCTTLTSFCLAHTHPCSRRAKKLFRGKRVGGGVVVVPLRHRLLPQTHQSCLPPSWGEMTTPTPSVPSTGPLSQAVDGARLPWLGNGDMGQEEQMVRPDESPHHSWHGGTPLLRTTANPDARLAVSPMQEMEERVTQPAHSRQRSAGTNPIVCGNDARDSVQPGRGRASLGDCTYGPLTQLSHVNLGGASHDLHTGVFVEDSVASPVRMLAVDVDPADKATMLSMSPVEVMHEPVYATKRKPQRQTVAGPSFLSPQIINDWPADEQSTPLQFTGDSVASAVSACRRVSFLSPSFSAINQVLANLMISPPASPLVAAESPRPLTTSTVMAAPHSTQTACLAPHWKTLRMGSQGSTMQHQMLKSESLGSGWTTLVLLAELLDRAFHSLLPLFGSVAPYVEQGATLASEFLVDAISTLHRVGTDVVLTNSNVEMVGSAVIPVLLVLSLFMLSCMFWGREVDWTDGLGKASVM